MAQNGTVTITARVDAAQAQRALELLEKESNNLKVSYGAASDSQVQGANRARQAVDLQTQAMEKAREVAQELGKSFGIGAAGGLTAFTLAVGAGVVAVDKLGQAFRYSIQESAKLESSMTTLKVVAGVTGQSFDQLKGLVNEYSDAISSPAAVASAVRIFSTMNMSMDQQRELIKGIRDGIVAMGGDVNEQLPLMALAIKRQDSQLLDNMGVTKTIEMMYKEYAKTLGITADKLNQAQKEQAVINGVMQETGKYTGLAQKSTDTYTGSVNNLKSAQRDLATAIGDNLNPALRTANNLLATFIRDRAKALSGRYDPEEIRRQSREITGESKPSGLPLFPGVPYASTILGNLKASEPLAKSFKELSAEELKKSVAQGTEDGVKKAAKDSTGGSRSGGTSSHRATASSKQENIGPGTDYFGARINYLLRGGSTSAGPEWLGYAPGSMGWDSFGSKLGGGSLKTNDSLLFAGINAAPSGPSEYQIKQTTDLLQSGTERALSDALSAVAQGDLGGLPDKLGASLQQMASDGLSKAMMGSIPVQNAIGSLGAALSGPTGIAAAFGVGLVGAIVGAGQRARQEAEDFQSYLDGLNNRYNSGNLSESQRIQRDKEQDPTIKALRNRLRDAETQAESYSKFNDPNSKDKAAMYGAQADAIRKELEAAGKTYDAAIERAKADEKAAKSAEMLAHSLQVAKDRYEKSKDFQTRAEDAEVVLGLRDGSELDRERKKKEAINQAVDLVGGWRNFNFMEGMVSAGRTDELPPQLRDVAVNLNKILQAIDKERVGTTPQNPMYIYDVTPRDSFSFTTRESFFRGSSPGTRRAFDNRGINSRSD